MPELENDRRERFCQEYVKDLNGTQAEIRAGYSPRTARVKVSQLLAVPEVQERVAELKAGVAERNAITVDEIVGNLRESRGLAHEHKQISAAVQAEASVAKVSGHWIDSHKDVSEAPPVNEAEVAKMMAPWNSAAQYVLVEAFRGNPHPLYELIEIAGPRFKVIEGGAKSAEGKFSA